MDITNHVQRSSKKWISVAQKLAEVNSSLQQLKEKKDDLVSKLKKLSGEVSSYGDRYAYTKIVSNGRIKYSSIPELKKIDLEPYRGKEIEMWKFSIRY